MPVVNTNAQAQYTKHKTFKNFIKTSQVFTSLSVGERSTAMISVSVCLSTVTGIIYLGGYEGYAYPLPSKVEGYYTPTFKRYKMPSFELKLRRNARAAGALPRTPLRELTALPQTL